MARIASRVCLSAWAGFLAAAAFRVLDAASLLPAAMAANANDLLSALPAETAIALDPVSAYVFSALLGFIAVLLGAAIVMSTSASRRIVAEAERLAAAGLAATFAFWACATIASAPVATVFGEGWAYCIALAFGFAALLFDHVVHADESESDRAFEHVMRQIENREPIRDRSRGHADDERGNRR